jgi:hypothetical protein
MAPICAVLGDPEVFFCTKTCSAAGAPECGTAATCTCNSGGSCGCTPDKCL